jgi:hypothetical protein
VLWLASFFFPFRDCVVDGPGIGRDRGALNDAPEHPGYRAIPLSWRFVRYGNTMLCIETGEQILRGEE